MYLPAISIGYAVPTEHFDASVHSVFQSAMNLRLKGEPGLLTLIASTESDLPQGIRLDTPDGFSFERFQTGEAALCRDGILQFEDSSLTIQLSGARRWKCNLLALKFDGNNPAVSAAWSLVWESLNERQILKEAEILAGDLFHWGEPARTAVSHKVREAMQDILKATRHYELTDTSVVNSLIGLGSGLTPSGDDLLVGYMAGLWCTVRAKTERAQFISSLGKTIMHLSRNTNDISRTYLYHAAQGQVSSRLANLAVAICRGENPELLLHIAETAMNVGHTSGMETVTGLLVGLSIWEGEHLFSI